MINRPCYFCGEKSPNYYAVDNNVLNLCNQHYNNLKDDYVKNQETQSLQKENKELKEQNDKLWTDNQKNFQRFEKLLWENQSLKEKIEKIHNLLSVSDKWEGEPSYDQIKSIIGEKE